jgi:hypothetical protein
MHLIGLACASSCALSSPTSSASSNATSLGSRSQSPPRGRVGLGRAHCAMMSPASPQRGSAEWGATDGGVLCTNGAVTPATPRSSGRRQAPAAQKPSQQKGGRGAYVQDAVAASVWSASPARHRRPESSADDAARADSAKCTWVVHETHPYLLTRLDGKKRWFHCSKCEYWNDRLYHTKMHYERIHVNQGRSMPRKRKYADPGAGEGPDGLRTPAPKAAADAGHTATPHQKGGHAPIETTPKGKGSMVSNNKTTPSLLRGSCGPSPSKKPRVGNLGSSPASASGAVRVSPGAKVSQVARRAALPQQWAASANGAAKGSKEAEVDQPSTRVFTFGSFFFQDEGLGLFFDVADMRPSLASQARANSNAHAKASRSHTCSASPRQAAAKMSGACGSAARAPPPAVGHTTTGRGGQELGKIEDAEHRGGLSCDSKSLSAKSAGSTFHGTTMQHPPESPSIARSPMHGQDWRRKRVEELGEATRNASLSARPNDASPGPSPHRPNGWLLVAPVTPVIGRNGFFSSDRSPAPASLRSPALGDGMHALRGMHDAMPGLPPGSLLDSCSTSERRSSLLYSSCYSGSSLPSGGISGFLSAPNSCSRTAREMSIDAVVPQHSRRRIREGSSELLSALAGLGKESGGAHGGIHGGSVPLMGYMPGLESDNLLFCGESLDTFVAQGP